jgi:hypothetical protein
VQPRNYRKTIHDFSPLLVRYEKRQMAAAGYHTQRFVSRFSLVSAHTHEIKTMMDADFVSEENHYAIDGDNGAVGLV